MLQLCEGDQKFPPPPPPTPHSMPPGHLPSVKARYTKGMDHTAPTAFLEPRRRGPKCWGGVSGLFCTSAPPCRVGLSLRDISSSARSLPSSKAERQKTVGDAAPSWGAIEGSPWGCASKPRAPTAASGSHSFGSLCCPRPSPVSFTNYPAFSGASEQEAGAENPSCQRDGSARGMVDVLAPT